MYRAIASIANAVVSIDLQCNHNVSILNIVWLFMAGNLINQKRCAKNQKAMGASRARAREKVTNREKERVRAREGHRGKGWGR